jgi:aryl-alcohol dehydrogenase-like predicted oxidoreductase
MTQNAYARRKVGGTNVEVSALGFGGAPVGGFRYTVSEQQAADTVSAAAEAGVSYFDTSPFYGYGRSELVFGHALRARPRSSRRTTTAATACSARWSNPCCGSASRASTSFSSTTRT